MLSRVTGVRVPPELQAVRTTVLEDYSRQRLTQYGDFMVTRLARQLPQIPQEIFSKAAREALAALPPPEYGQVSIENLDLQLVFRHDCLALGCLDPQCVLCQHNPHRRCSMNFDRKYLVNDILKAKCTAVIRVELIDRATGLLVEEDLPELRLEMNILDGNLYDQKFLENARPEGSDEAKDLEQCGLLTNNKTQPLLLCGGGGTNDVQGRVLLTLSRGKAQLPDLHVTDSSEALLSGRKPPFRLVVRAVHKDGRKLNIRHAVSEGFVVATRRTRTAGKVDIPSVDDYVGKLEHMGKETVKKLQDIRTAAEQAGVQIEIPENCVQKVGEFKLLSLRAEQDGHLRQKLQHVLKLSKEKWDEARDHAMRAVVADNRMRAWYHDKRNLEVGLLFTCRLGTVDLERPVGLLQKKVEGGETKIEATLMAQQTPAQRELVRQLQPEAMHSWWMLGHPGWAIFPMDSEQFLQTGLLVPQADVGALSGSPQMSRHTPSPPPVPDMVRGLEPPRGYNEGIIRPIPGYGSLQALSPPQEGSTSPFRNPTAMTSAIQSPFSMANNMAPILPKLEPDGANRMPPPHNNPPSTSSGGAMYGSLFEQLHQANRMPQHQQGSGSHSPFDSSGMTPPLHSAGNSGHSPHAPPAATLPWSTMSAPATLGNSLPPGLLQSGLQSSLFGSGLNGLGLQAGNGAMPSMQGTGGPLQSQDLDALMGMDMPSLDAYKMTSLELPDAGTFQGDARAAALMNLMGANMENGMQRANSGLQNMQSIESALPEYQQGNRQRQ